jgi:hypothetical protein
MWRESEAVSRPERAWVVGVLCLLAGCEQLGNPPQFATGPTDWKDENGHVVTTTRSFRNEKTIQRLVAEGLGDLDHRDASIGPSQTLTLVSVAPRSLRRQRRGKLELVTIFKVPERAPIVRRWKVPASSRHWNAAFALPLPPIGAATSVAP